MGGNVLSGSVWAAALAGMARIPAAALAQDAGGYAPESYKVAVRNASIRSRL